MGAIYNKFSGIGSSGTPINFVQVYDGRAYGSSTSIPELANYKWALVLLYGGSGVSMATALVHIGDTTPVVVGVYYGNYNYLHARITIDEHGVITKSGDTNVIIGCVYGIEGMDDWEYYKGTTYSSYNTGIRKIT